MDRKTVLASVVNLVVAVLLCVCVFFFLSVHMNSQSARTINEVGTLYMSSMSEQISLHFSTTMELRLNQLDAMIKTIVPTGAYADAALRARLAETAQAMEFSNLGFYDKDGSFDMLFGPALTVTDPEPFLGSMMRGEKKICIGTDGEGNSVILLGVPTSHSSTQAHSRIGLVAGLPVSYLSDTLSLNEDESDFYNFIIREDGSYVIRSSQVVRDNYFDRVHALYGDVDGKTPEQYLAELRQAMARREDYSGAFSLQGERRHLYCTRLGFSEWYLLTFMPYGAMDSIVTGFGREWSTATVMSCVIVLAALGWVFAKYLGLMRRQLRRVEEARREAEDARREAEDAQKEAEHANRAKSEFLSNMSHDIRTPMNAIVGMTAIAMAGIDDKEQVRSSLKKIALSSKHLLGLINDVLDMSKIESGKMTLSYDLVCLREVMDSIVSIVQPQVKAKRQSFEVSIHDISHENVYCDSVRLNQVLLNLLSNAVKFTPDGGTIRVALYEEASPRGEGYVRIRIRVKDNGIGMSREFKERIFESFSREDSQRVHHTEGTGLGMAITKFIVDAMGGSITVDSEQGKGSDFHITLDMEKAEASEADMLLPPWNMLVVDDDAQLCRSAVTSLESIGIRADWTHDGESAVQKAVERAGRADSYEVILLDWKLPGIDGLETARRIRESLERDVPILLISAYDWSEIEADAREAGINGFIPKPLFKSTLYHGLKPYLAPGGEEEQAREEGGKGDLSGRHILLAEDNELNWEIAAELLSELGLELEWAENGRICVDKFLASKPGDYDAVLMDLRMPEMNGYEATRRIRESGRPDAELPIIAMTADAFAEDARRCLEAGMNAHVAKPIDVREVARLLEKFMNTDSK